MRPLPRLPRPSLRRFVRDEEGSMVIFAMFIFLAMLIVGGMSVDLMRFETNRARLQATLDRAVLAAADLDQTLSPRAVVEDYFRKAQLFDQLTSISVTETFNSRTVGATAGVTLNTFFMDMVGVRTLNAGGASTARENVNDIEIVLVLDVSGSMLANNRLVNLKSAARDFVQTVLRNDTENRISIAMVPFNGQVNLGPTLRGWYTGITDIVTSPANVNCVDLPPSVYSTQSIARNLAMPATQHADTFSTTTRSNAYYQISANAPVGTNVWCPPSTGNIVRLPARNITTLQNNINALEGIGATSINAGMRWGMTLLDPNSRTMFNSFISGGHIPSFYSGRPYNWRRENTLKVIVLMTDGEHFAEERVNDGYRGNAISPIWRATNSDAYFSIFHESRVDRTSATTLANSRPFWVPHLAQWHARPWNGTSPATNVPYVEGSLRRIDVNGDGVCDNRDDGRGTLKSNEACWWAANQQTWGQAWSAVRMHWVAWQLYGRPLSSTSTGRIAIADQWMNTFRTLTPTTTMDNQLQQMCGRARSEGVIVFGIAFEAPPGGEREIFNCASSPAHYYNAQGLQIATAFRAIAAQINALRLIQ
jgi:Flp pilus assembly protein TadG